MSAPPFRHLLSAPAPGSARAGAAAWESAFEACYVDLCEYVLRLVGSAEAAEDIVHDLFLQLWHTRGVRDQDRLSRPYLYAAARNRALKYLRHRRVVAAWTERASHEEPPVADSPEDECLRRELGDAVERAIAALPGRCREIFVLRRRDQLGYREIAMRLGVSLGRVTSPGRGTSGPPAAGCSGRAAVARHRGLPRFSCTHKRRIGPCHVAGERRRCGPRGSPRRSRSWSPAPPSGRTVRRPHRHASTRPRPGSGRRSRCLTARACCSASARDSWCRVTTAASCAPWSSKAKRTSSYGTIRRAPSSFAPHMVRPRILAPSSTFVPTERSGPCRSSWPPVGWRCGARRRPIPC